MSNPSAQSHARSDAESPVCLSYDLMQMTCVCKSWNSIISDPKFIKLHLKRSARNPYLTLSTRPHIPNNVIPFRFLERKVIPFPVHPLILENPWILLPENLRYECQVEKCRYAIGSCNGLFCLISYSFNSYMSEPFHFYVSEPGEFWFRFWNRVIHTMSKKLGHFTISKKLRYFLGHDFCHH